MKSWHLIDSDESLKLIDNKWVFKVNGNSERPKARLVARGFTLL